MLPSADDQGVEPAEGAAKVPAQWPIADIANWAWVRTHKWSGVSVDGLEHLRRWMGAMNARPACQRGIEVPFRLPDLGDDADAGKEFAKAAESLLQK